MTDASLLMVCQACGDDALNLMISENGMVNVFCKQSAHEVMGLQTTAELYDVVKEAQEENG